MRPSSPPRVWRSTCSTTQHAAHPRGHDALLRENERITDRPDFSESPPHSVHKTPLNENNRYDQELKENSGSTRGPRTWVRQPNADMAPSMRCSALPSTMALLRACSARPPAQPAGCAEARARVCHVRAPPLAAPHLLHQRLHLLEREAWRVLCQRAVVI